MPDVAEELPGLSIGDLAEATGVAPGTLRMWESRHGFPRARRLPGGHRRYDRAEVERVQRVGRGRDRGLSLAAAIDEAMAWAPQEPPSVFSALRAADPRVEARVLPMASMVAVSHAIEDECLSRARRPVLFGSFQTPAAYGRAEPRWSELARTAETAVVVADFPRVRRAGGRAVERPLAPDSPVRREWSVVCVDDECTIALAGWERPDRTDGRAFEAAWTTAPRAAAATLRAGLRLGGAEDELTDAAEATLGRAEATDEPHGATTLALAARMVAYLGAAPGTP